MNDEEEELEEAAAEQDEEESEREKADQALYVARKEYRAQIEELATSAFKDHVLTKMDGHWRCMKPETGFYAFRVAELPGLLVLWGDIETVTITQGAGYNIDWLRGAIKSMEYILEKSVFKKDSFVGEMWNTYREKHKDAENFEDGYTGYLEYVQTSCDDVEHASHATHDWPPAALWGYWALKKFCELLGVHLEKEKADVKKPTRKPATKRKARRR